MIIYAGWRDSHKNMEGNKDEAKKCLEIARRYLAKGDKEKAKRFLSKSQKLYPLKEAESKYFNAFIFGVYCRLFKAKFQGFSVSCVLTVFFFVKFLVSIIFVFLLKL